MVGYNVRHGPVVVNHLVEDQAPTDLPADVCENCREAYVAEAVSERLVAMTTEARTAHAQVLVHPFAPAA